MNEQDATDPTTEVTCPQCGLPWAWIGDHGASISLYGVCLHCLYGEDTLEELRQAMAEDDRLPKIVDERERRETLLDARAFPCVFHKNGRDCKHCHGRGWIVGKPPSIRQTV